MRILALFSILTVIATALLPVSAHAQGPTRELTLAAPLTAELNLVLRAADSLHKSLISRDEEQIEMNIRDMLWQLDKAKGALGYAKMHERGHLVRILEGAQEQFEITQRAFGEERRLRLVAGYNQLVNLDRIYKLDRSYSIFFCPKDRSTWIQKGTHPAYPFRLPQDHESCGIRVPK